MTGVNSEAEGVVATGESVAIDGLKGFLGAMSSESGGNSVSALWTGDQPQSDIIPPTYSVGLVGLGAASRCFSRAALLASAWATRFCSYH